MPGARRSVEPNLLDGADKAVPQAVPERPQTHCLRAAFVVHDLGRRAEARDARYVECARAQPTFVAATEDLRDGGASGLQGVSDIERTHSLRAVHLVCGDARQVDVHVVDGERQIPEALRGVAVKRDPAFVRESADRGEVLYDADFVVGKHHTHQHRIVGERVGNCIH